MKADPYAERARAAHARGETLTLRQLRRLGLRLPPVAGPRWGDHTWPQHTLSRVHPR